MIKKIFSKRSGFTLVEIIVAFAIFAIMATMITQILMLAMNERRHNQQFADKLAAQEETLAANGRTATFDGATNTLSLEFVDGPTVDIDYDMKAPDGTEDIDGIAYFVSEKSASDNGSLGWTGGSTGDGDTPSGGVSQRMDTRLAGSKGYSSITVSKCEKATGDLANGASNRYIFNVILTPRNHKSDPSDVVMTNELAMFAQLKMYFYTDDYTIEEKFQTDENGQKYRKKVPNPATVTGCGYLTIGGGAVTNSKPMSTLYEVSKLSGNAVRLGVPPGTSVSDMSGKTSVWFYVDFASDPHLTTASFGSNGVAGDYGGHVYQNVVEPSDDGNDTVLPNIYGGGPYIKVDKNGNVID